MKRSIKETGFRKYLFFFSAIFGALSFVFVSVIVSELINIIVVDVLSLSVIFISVVCAFVQLIFYDDVTTAMMQKSSAEFLKIRTELQIINIKKDNRKNEMYWTNKVDSILEKYCEATEESTPFLGHELDNIDKKLLGTSKPSTHYYTSGLAEAGSSFRGDAVSKP